MGGMGGQPTPLNRVQAFVVVLLGTALGFALGVYLVFQPESTSGALPTSVSQVGTDSSGSSGNTGYEPPPPTPLPPTPEWVRLMDLHAEGKFELLTGVDAEYLPLFINSMLSLSTWGMHRDVKTVCYDEETCELIEEAGYENVVRDEFVHETAYFLIHQLACYADKTPDEVEAAVRGFASVLLHSQLLGNDIGFFTFSSDVCFLRNPILDFMAPRETIVATVQVEDLHATDNGQLFVEGYPHKIRLNLGTAVVKAQPDVRTLFAQLHGDVFLHLCEDRFEEGSFNRILFDEGLRLDLKGDYFKGNVLQSSVRTLPIHYFATGCATDMIDDSTEFHVVNPLCKRDLADKISFLKENGCWYLRNDWFNVPRTGNLDEYMEAVDNRVLDR